jgi:hypothetical protein
MPSKLESVSYCAPKKRYEVFSYGKPGSAFILFQVFYESAFNHHRPGSLQLSTRIFKKIKKIAKYLKLSP